MPIITILITLVFVGIILWLINNYIPMAQPIKMILNVVVVLCVLVWLLRVFGVFGTLSGPVRLAGITPQSHSFLANEMRERQLR